MRPLIRSIPVGVALLVLFGACASDDADQDAAEPTIATTPTTADPATTGAANTVTAPTTTEAGPGGTMPDPTPTSTPIERNPEKPIPETATPATTSGADEPWFPGQIDPGLAPFVDLATDDLANRLNIAPTDITTASAVLVSWPDTSLGCPMPGMEYAQVLQDGSLVELEYDDGVYRYHSGGSRSPFLCETSSVMPTAVVGITDDE